MNSERFNGDLAESLFEAQSLHDDWRRDPFYQTFVKAVARILIEKTHERKQNNENRIVGRR